MGCRPRAWLIPTLHSPSSRCTAAELQGLEDPDILQIALIAIAIEELALIWAASGAEEWTNRLVWIFAVNNHQFARPQSYFGAPAPI